MLESISDAIQLLVLGLCLAASLIRALRARNMMWVTLFCFYGCMLLGNMYWLGYLLVFKETPYYSNIPDLSWAAAYIFLFMLVYEAERQRGVLAPIRAAWLPVGACAACCIYYISTSGAVLINLLDNGLMAGIGFCAVRGLLVHEEKPLRKRSEQANALAFNRLFHVAALAFVAVEETLWLSSGFLEPGPIETFQPYILLNLALSAASALLLICAWSSETL